MTKIADLLGSLIAIADQLQDAKRTEPQDATLAGWGQFVNSPYAIHQIGPYGTSAGVLVKQIAHGAPAEDQRIVDRLKSYWEERPQGKLFPQNVRLAFIVLCLAKVENLELKILRDKIISELRTRQFPDGSWCDAVQVEAANPGGQIDATAWIILALHRTNKEDASAKKGAEWLLHRGEGVGSIELLSPIAIAAVLKVCQDRKKTNELRRKAFRLLADKPFSKEELISFYDYEETDADGIMPKRDYLCFPAFYPTAIILRSLAYQASLTDHIRLNRYRTDAVERLNKMISSNLYKLTGAKFASTVDQAVVALTYEELKNAEEGKSLTASGLIPFYNFLRESAIFRFYLPGFAAAAGAIISTDSVALFDLSNWIGLPVSEDCYAFFKAHNKAIEFAGTIAFALMTIWAKSGAALAWNKIFRK